MEVSVGLPTKVFEIDAQVMNSSSPISVIAAKDHYFDRDFLANRTTAPHPWPIAECTFGALEEFSESLFILTIRSLGLGYEQAAILCYCIQNRRN